MFSYRTDIAECIIRTEIKDWFKKLLDETFGLELQVRYLSNHDHFNVNTYVEISGSESRIKQAIKFIISTSEITNYKMPWLSENSYYIYGPSEELIIETLQILRNRTLYFDYFCETYNMIGITIRVFNFPPHLDEALKLELDKSFRLLAYPTPLFIMYPKTTTTLNLSSNHKPINILTAFHGKFLSYLSLEDILSLEIANKRQYNNSYHDVDLNHDIQKFLRNNFSLLNEIAATDNISLMSFRTNEVLTYFIHKYHDRLVKCFIPNILTADEIKSLAHPYNIEFEYHDIIHIDFRTTNETETVDFCAINHFDLNHVQFYNYDPKYATQNYSINFNADNTLDPLDGISEFSTFVIKSQNNCSPHKLNSLLQYVIEYFRPCQRNPVLALYEFDLNQVSKHIISSLVQMMCRGLLLFREMYFNSATLYDILHHADENRFIFRKCNITDVADVEIISKTSKCCELEFCDMDIDVNLFRILRNYVRLAIRNCRILNTSRNNSINLNISNDTSISFIHTTLDISTLLRVLNCVQFVSELIFADCNLTSDDRLDSRYFIFRNRIHFINMIFEIQNLFQIFEYCEIQSRMSFVSCHFRHVNNTIYKFSLKPVKIQFLVITFDLLVLVKMLETLHAMSEVWISQSRISEDQENTFNELTRIRVKRIMFNNCRFEIQTLHRMLRKMSEHTEVHIIRCDLLPSIAINSCITVNIIKIFFCDMRFNPQFLFTILGLFKENSIVRFRRCEISAAGSVDFYKISLPNKIEIHFRDMLIESQIVHSLLHTDSLILFDDCCLNFITENNSNTSIQTRIIFRNMKFELSTILKYLAGFTPKSSIQFVHCDFTSTNCLIPSIEIKPLGVLFAKMLFDLEVLVTWMEQMSEQTILTIIRCNIQPTKLFSIRPIRIPIIYFENMNFEIETILCIFKNFANPARIYFTCCEMLCSNATELLDLNLKSNFIVFQDMNIDVHIFQIFLQKCSNETTICLNNCTIRPACCNILPIISVDIKRIVFLNFNYTPDLLQILQYVNGKFIVEFHDQLSNKAIIEICTKTLIYGKRLMLVTQICTKSFYFELFAEYFRQKVLNSKINTEAEYDPPTFLIPHISSKSGDIDPDWNELRIKVVPVNDTSLKLEFLRNGKPIDLFYELNDLPDNSDVCVVDYF